MRSSLRDPHARVLVVAAPIVAASSALLLRIDYALSGGVLAFGACLVLLYAAAVERRKPWTRAITLSAVPLATLAALATLPQGIAGLDAGLLIAGAAVGAAAAVAAGVDGRDAVSRRTQVAAGAAFAGGGMILLMPGVTPSLAINLGVAPWFLAGAVVEHFMRRILQPGLGAVVPPAIAVAAPAIAYAAFLVPWATWPYVTFGLLSSLLYGVWASRAPPPPGDHASALLRGLEFAVVWRFL